MQKLKKISFSFSREQVITFLVFAITTLLIFISFAPVVHAFTDKITPGWQDTINSGVSEAIKDIFEQDGAIYKALVTDNTIVAPVYNILAGISAAIAVLFIYIDVIQEVLHGQDKVECFIKGLIKGIVVCLLILLLTRILTELETLGQSLYSEVTKTIKDATTSPENPGFDAKMFSDKNTVFGFLARMVGTFFPWLLAQISILVAQVVAYSVIIELTIRKMFSPLAVANISMEGFRGPGMRWFKKYLALYIRMILICVLGYINGGLVAVVIQNLSGIQVAFGVVVVNFTVVTMMIKSSELANEIMGV